MAYLYFKGSLPRQGKSPISSYRVKISYINEGGGACSAIIKDPMKIHHAWYSSKRNACGKYERHEVTILSAFLTKLRKSCSRVISVMEVNDGQEQNRPAI